mmetsp:Transcript_27539/g.40479  ORF Transcript_27539/g.40479 Transcript_27539/m.40479 type:complete len:249 (+) Transcript_27539:123-869(+)
MQQDNLVIGTFRLPCWYRRCEELLLLRTLFYFPLLLSTIPWCKIFFSCFYRFTTVISFFPLLLVLNHRCFSIDNMFFIPFGIIILLRYRIVFGCRPILASCKVNFAFGSILEWSLQIFWENSAIIINVIHGHNRQPTRLFFDDIMCHTIPQNCGLCWNILQFLHQRFECIRNFYQHQVISTKHINNNSWRPIGRFRYSQCFLNSIFGRIFCCGCPFPIFGNFIPFLPDSLGNNFCIRVSKQRLDLFFG